MKQYETYKDSRVEWIGEIPEHWERIKFKHITTMMTCGHAATPQYVEEGGKPFLSAQNIKKEDISLSVLKFVTSELHEKLTKNHKVEKGDLLQVRVGGKDTIGQTAIFNLDFDVSIYVSLAHIKLNKLAFNGYVQFLCNSIEFKNYCGVLMKKGAGVANLNVSDVEIMRIPLPPLQEQTQIANYLNYKTEQLDSLIAKKEQLISLLQEERKAMINQVVTKGLDPNVPMKDSGIEWLGKIPEHWCNSNLKWFCEIYSGGTPSKNIDEYWINGTVPWLNSGTVNQGNIIKPSHFITNDALNNSSAKWIPEKSLVIALAGQGKTKGMVAQVMFKATCNQSMGIIVPNERIDNRFLMYWLRNNYQKIRNLGGGDKRDGLNLQMIGSIPIPIPPLNEQIKISNFINKQNDDTKSLISKIQNEINLLKEYKTALISEVVTGKVDVREEVIN